MILDERGFEDFVTWAQRASDFLQVFGNPPMPTTGERWREWGADLGKLPTMPLYPSPYPYNDWRSWVQDLNRTVQAQ